MATDPDAGTRMGRSMPLPAPMYTLTENPPTELAPAQASFAESPVTITLSSAGPDGMPNVARGFGCRIGRQNLRLYVLRSQAHSLLSDLEQCPLVAAVFGEMGSRRSLHVRGDLLRIAWPDSEDLQRAERYRTRLATEAARYGYAREVLDNLLHFDADDLAVIELTLREVDGVRDIAPQVKQ